MESDWKDINISYTVYNDTGLLMTYERPTPTPPRTSFLSEASVFFNDTTCRCWRILCSTTLFLLDEKDLLLTIQTRMISSFLSSVILTEKSAVLCFLVCLPAVWFCLYIDVKLRINPQVSAVTWLSALVSCSMSRLTFSGVFLLLRNLHFPSSLISS